MTQVEREAPGARTLQARQCRRVLILGATGTAGRATTAALIRAGHDVVCFARPDIRVHGSRQLPPGAEIRLGDVLDPDSLARDGIRGEHFDAIVSCMASRTGAPADAWAIDYGAHASALRTARAAGIRQMVLLSAICVQRPMLSYQQAKLAFERELMASGLTYSIVRPTAFFKSLSGQVDRVRRGRAFLLFGDGLRTACKPISDGDLGRYMAECLTDTSRHDRILPIGGPGDAVTPRQQGEHLFRLLKRRPRFRHVPLAMMDVIQSGLQLAGRFSPVLAEKAELARIGRYYATESMLLFDPASGRYDAAQTPSTGTETLFDFYSRLIEDGASVERGAHKVF